MLANAINRYKRYLNHNQNIYKMIVLQYNDFPISWIIVDIHILLVHIIT